MSNKNTDVVFNTTSIHVCVDHESISVNVCRDSGSVSTHVIPSIALKKLYRTNIHAHKLDLSIMATNCPNNVLALTVYVNQSTSAVRVVLTAKELCSFAVRGCEGEKCTSCFEGIVRNTENVIVRFD